MKGYAHFLGIRPVHIPGPHLIDSPALAVDYNPSPVRRIRRDRKRARLRLDRRKRAA